MRLRALIVGAGGFLGRATCAAFVASGFETTALSRHKLTYKEEQLRGALQYVNGNIDRGEIFQQIGAQDIVVHCAGGGSVARAAENPVEDLTSSVSTLSFALNFVREKSPHAKFIFPSSAAVYGQAERFPISENAAAKPISTYGYHKLMAETLCRSYYVNYGVSISIIRFFSLYGEGLQKQLFWDACRKLSADKSDFSGSGQEVRDWLHIEDAVELISMAAARPHGCFDIVNGGSGIGMPVRGALELLYQGLGATRSPEFRGAILAGDPAAYCADISKASEWGWQPRIPLEDGLRRYANWYLENFA